MKRIPALIALLAAASAIAAISGEPPAPPQIRHISPDLQKAVVEAGPPVHAELLDWTKNFYNEGVKAWKEKTKDGWIELTAEQRAAFRARMQGVDEKVAAQVPGVKEWLDLLRAKSKQHMKN